VVAAGRLYDAKRQASVESTRAADAKVREVFLGSQSTAADRAIALPVFREARRKAVIGTVDSLFEVKALVSKKEWNAIWPKDYFSFGAPAPVLAERVPAAVVAAVSDPERQKKASEVAAAFVKGAESKASARERAKGRLAKYLADYGTERDAFIEATNDLEEKQSKTDEAVVEAASRLQEIMTPDEWGAFVKRMSAEAP
jgi:hypothetical protein